MDDVEIQQTTSGKIDALKRQNAANAKQKEILYGNAGQPVASMTSQRILQSVTQTSVFLRGGGEVVIDMDLVENKWTETLELNGETKEFKPDTGAGVIAIPAHHYSTEIHGTLQLPKIPLYGLGREPLR